MDLLFLCAYALFCGIVVYWKIVKPWNAARRARRADDSEPLDIDIANEAELPLGHAGSAGEPERNLARDESVDLPVEEIPGGRRALPASGKGPLIPELGFGSGVGWNPEPARMDIMKAPISLAQQRQAEIQSFSSPPQAKRGIESRFHGIEVTSLRNLEILSGAEEAGRFDRYLWSEPASEPTNRKEEKSDRTRPRMDTPAASIVEDLLRFTEPAADPSPRRDSPAHEDPDWDKRR
jgi:hypothetical protein